MLPFDAVAATLNLLPRDVVDMETEALEAMGNNARGVDSKRWRYA